jgi:hypothetical protein
MTIFDFKVAIIRRECLDHFIVLHERGLHHSLKSISNITNDRPRILRHSHERIIGQLVGKAEHRPTGMTLNMAE